MTDYKGKRFCVLGDSISTFSGYTPEEAVFYNSPMQRMTGVTDVNLTWWMQVINHFGGVLGVNNSYAGSTVYGTRPTSGNSDERTQALGAAGAPDVILISMGGNDCASASASSRSSAATTARCSEADHDCIPMRRSGAAI